MNYTKFFLIASLFSGFALVSQHVAAETAVVVVEEPSEKSLGQKAVDALKAEYDDICSKIEQIKKELTDSSLGESVIKAKHSILEKLEIAKEKAHRAFNKALNNEDKAESYWKRFKNWWHKNS